MPVLEIEKDPELAYEYTDKGNLVAVISNGTAILGLGDRGSLASKPVMEGKGVLFKKFADLDGFDIEVNSHDPEVVIMVARPSRLHLAGSTWKTSNRRNVFTSRKSSRACWISRCSMTTSTARQSSSAALVNALEIVGKKHEDVTMVISGAGASAISCANLAMRWGSSAKIS